MCKLQSKYYQVVDLKIDKKIGQKITKKERALEQSPFFETTAYFFRRFLLIACAIVDAFPAGFLKSNGT